jgi:hypothetical protein
MKTRIKYLLNINVTNMPEMCTSFYAMDATSGAGTAYPSFQSTRVHPRFLVGFVLLDL